MKKFVLFALTIFFMEGIMELNAQTGAHNRMASQNRHNKMKNAVWWLFGFSCLAGTTQMNAQTAKNFPHITAQDTVSVIVNNPAFTGFGEQLLPWNDRDYNLEMPINNIGSLMPYHNYVVPTDVVNALNRMISDVNSGKTIFYDIYNTAQKRNESAKQQTGLFFFRGKANAPFAVVCPGGGFSYVGSLHEGFPIADAISKQGYNVFVIKYRVGSEQRATDDLAAAIAFIIANAKSLEVDTKNYSVWGGSAGGRMAANIGSQYALYNLPKPCIAVVLYTGHSAYTRNDPPTFSAVGENDGIANPVTMERRITAMRNAGIDVEFHTYKNTRHGFGLGTGTNAEGWLTNATAFWQRHIL